MADSLDDIRQELKGSTQIHSNNDTTITPGDGDMATKGEIIVHQGIDRKSYAQLLEEKLNLEQKLSQLDEEDNEQQQVQIAFEATKLAKKMQKNKNIEYDAWKLLEIGAAAELARQFGRAERWYKQAQRKFKIEDDKIGEALSLAYLGWLAIYRHGEYDVEETDFYQESLAIEKKVGNRKFEAKRLRDVLLSLADYWGDHDEVERLSRDNLAISIQIGDRKGEAVSLNNLGNVARKGGDLVEAERLYREGLAIAREIGNREEVANILANISSMPNQEREDLDEAERLQRASLAIEKEIGNRQGEASSLRKLGLIAKERGDLNEAERLHQESLAIDREIGNRRGEAMELSNLASIKSLQKEDEEAERLYREILSIQREIGDHRGEADTLFELSIIAENRGEDDVSNELIRESREILLRIDEEE